MSNEKELQELKKRIDVLEMQVRNKPRASNFLRFIAVFSIVFFVLLVLIGIYQFTNEAN